MKLEPLSQKNVEAIIRCNGGNGWKNDLHHWAQMALEHSEGRRFVAVVKAGAEVCGYGSLLWQSGYSVFRSSNIPEVHDIATVAAYRGKGVATMLLAEFERMAEERGFRRIGLGVGLYADYGPAQRLYASRGYVLDGNGATYRNRPVAPGSSVRVDDDLVLWLSKTLPIRQISN